MLAFQLESHSGPEGLRLVDLPEPPPDDHSVLLEVEAIGVNYPDLLATRGLYQHRPGLPFVPGCEVAGSVLQAPEGAPVSVGDRAAAFVWDGGFAERVRVPCQSIVSVPAAIDSTTAAGMLVNYHTAHFALTRRGQLDDRDDLLVLGAAGGIGTAAVQVAKGLGARVIGGVASEEQRATAETAGADHVLLLEPGFAGAVKELTRGRGVSLVLDPLGDWLFGEAIRALAPEGRILIVGFAAGQVPSLSVNRLLLRNVSAVGVAWGAFLELDPDLMASAASSLNRMVTAGAVRPLIAERFSFEEIPLALARLGKGQIQGKAVAERRPTSAGG